MYKFEVKSGYDKEEKVTYRSVVLVHYDFYSDTTITPAKIEGAPYVQIGESDSDTIIVCTSIVPDSSEESDRGEAVCYINGKLKFITKFDLLHDLVEFKDYFWETFDMVEISGIIGEPDYDEED